jgi:hypothetical protein
VVSRAVVGSFYGVLIQIALYVCGKM